MNYNKETIRTCEWCGKEYRAKSNNSKYCSYECQRKANRVQTKEQRQKKRAMNPSRKERWKDKITDTVCERKEWCRYAESTGIIIYCDYIEKEGHSRGCLPKDCPYFKKRKTKLVLSRNDGSRRERECIRERS